MGDEVLHETDREKDLGVDIKLNMSSDAHIKRITSVAYASTLKMDLVAQQIVDNPSVEGLKAAKKSILMTVGKHYGLLLHMGMVKTELLREIMMHWVDEQMLPQETLEQSPSTSSANVVTTGKVETKMQWQAELELKKLQLNAEQAQKRIEAEQAQKRIEAEQAQKRLEVEQAQKRIEAEQAKKTLEAKPSQELAMKRLEVEQAQKKLELEIRLAELGIRLENTSVVDLGTPGQLKVNKNVKFPLFCETDPDQLFIHLEKLARSMEWPETQWVSLLQGQLVEKAQRIFAAMPLSFDYEKEIIIVQGITGDFQTVPLREVNLVWDFIKSKDLVGVSPKLPVAGVDLIVGNDLAGNRVKRDDHPIMLTKPKVIRARTDPEDKVMYPTCAMTVSKSESQISQTSDNVSQETKLEVNKLNSEVELCDTFMAKLEEADGNRMGSTSTKPPRKRGFQQFCGEFGILHKTSTTYHPESQGALERMHLTLKQMLRTSCKETGRDWDDGLPLMLMALRDTYQESLGCSPNSLVFGHEVRNTLTILRDKWLEIRRVLCSNGEWLANVKTLVEHLSLEQKQDLEQLLTYHADIFGDIPTQTTVIHHEIEVTDTQPVKSHPYRVNPAKLNLIRKEVDYKLQHGLVRPSSSSWSSPYEGKINSETHENYSIVDRHALTTIELKLELAKLEREKQKEALQMRKEKAAIRKEEQERDMALKEREAALRKEEREREV
ncbi:early endosome antigen 1-like [Procambarus clarkii]|uniref:early endosome antigen 1-like n=1 Tax=Procambarus clarkii TaxID=6728 RepID=UPI0037438C6A